MGKIEIISASAGSGKTTRLAQLLLDEVRSKRVRPSAVFATTFTVKAAAELEQRVRIRLLAEGEVGAAHALQGARMGTVNAVCGRLVSDFAFELGLSPDLQVLDELLAEEALRRSLSQVVTPAEADELEGLSDRMPAFLWAEEVKRVIDLARYNGVEPKSFDTCVRRSVEEITALFCPPSKSASDQGPILEAELRQALEQFVADIQRQGDTTQVTAKALERARAALARLGAGSFLPWNDWLALTHLELAKKSSQLAEPVRSAAALHDQHPALLADVSRAVALTFEVAARALTAYQEEKRVRGALDFVDQEVLALRLLDRSDVRVTLAGELDLILVDEFQDTSPLQLALFLKLAELAPRSVWVGDQKQAIYGFRGTDPALMDAAIAQVLGANGKANEPETLAYSWRSRPELVRMTSRLFAPPFGRQGLPPSRVVLEPGLAQEPQGLGEVAEHWKLEVSGAKKTAPELLAVGEGIRQLLGDASVRVRDGHGSVRPPRTGDVAVLCRTNEQCSQLAQALESLGLPVVLRRPGLLSTPEVQTALAGLRLLIDPRDRLAAAQLGRTLIHPGDGDHWLAELLQSGEGSGPLPLPFQGAQYVQRLESLRQEHPSAGAVAALDAAMEGLELRDLCRRWGETPERLANLDQLRAHAVAYAEACGVEERGATPAGLLAHLDSLASGDQDVRPAPEGADAIEVNTWHGAKGLEWPVTVLYGLSHRAPPPALGVQVVSDCSEIDLLRPLAGRWIRFWPTPFHPAQSKADFHRRLEAHPVTAEAEARQANESLRLLYVGWTRARDRVVLADRMNLADLTALQPLLDENGAWPRQAAHSWKLRRPGPGLTAVRDSEPALGPPTRARVPHPPAVVLCSSTPSIGKARVGSPERIGERVAVSGTPEMAPLGQAIHGFLAADRSELSRESRQELASALLQNWRLDALTPNDLLNIGDRLRRWVERRLPGAAWHREWPVAYRQGNGTTLRGVADLVLELEGGLWVVDHKSYPGSVTDALARAERHAGQLGAYARAVQAAIGKPVLGCAIHLPLSGVVVPVFLGTG